MTLHLERYLSGACYFVGIRHLKGGRSVRVFDRTMRKRKAALALSRRGYTPALIADLLREPRPLVARLMDWNFRF